MVSQYWSWALSILGGFGIYLAGRKDWRAWVIALMCEVLWFTYAIVTKQYGFFLGVSIYTTVSIRNLIKWRREHYGQAS